MGSLRKNPHIPDVAERAKKGRPSIRAEAPVCDRLETERNRREREPDEQLKPMAYADALAMEKQLFEGAEGEKDTRCSEDTEAGGSFQVVSTTLPMFARLCMKRWASATRSRGNVRATTGFRRSAANSLISISMSGES